MEAENIYPSAPLFDDEIDTSHYNTQTELQPFRPSYEDIIEEYQKDINEAQRSVTYVQDAKPNSSNKQNVICIRYIDDRWKKQLLELAKEEEQRTYDRMI